MTISYVARWTYELEARILSFDEGVKTLSPNGLEEAIRKRIQTLTGTIHQIKVISENVSSQ